MFSSEAKAKPVYICLFLKSRKDISLLALFLNFFNLDLRRVSNSCFSCMIWYGRGKYVLRKLQKSSERVCKNCHLLFPHYVSEQANEWHEYNCEPEDSARVQMINKEEGIFTHVQLFTKMLDPVG